MSREKAAGGLEAVRKTAALALRSGLARTLPALARLNQPGGFDCPGCAWPDPSRRGPIEFCENGAKAVAHESRRALVDRDFFARWPLPRLLERPDRWLEAQGRLAEPLWRPRGADRLQPISWEAAFERAGRSLRELDDPNRAVFYTSGRTSNEAAFLYQLLAREFGTNNLPDCSNMCHESSGTGLGATLGIGKGTVTLEDFAVADLILVIGQNPGSNHPRMLLTLEEAARRGCRIASINPLRELGLVRFRNPQSLRGLVGKGTPLAQHFFQIRIGGDIPFLKGVMKALLQMDEEEGGVLDHGFIEQHTQGFETLRRDLESSLWSELEEGAGLPRNRMRELAELYAHSRAVIACWAMGLTQHRFGVQNVQEVTNLLLLGGHIGRPGAGPCPVRGHSNVQGDRTMGIWESPKPEFLDALDREFGIRSPRDPGLHTIDAIHAFESGRARIFVGMGGNFARATPDTPRVEKALGRAELAVHVATTLNRTHLVAGQEALLLPCLARSEEDRQAGGLQFVTVEDSMACVHRSQGRLHPVSKDLRSEPAIVAGIARAALGERSRIPWEDLVEDYDRIRERIARVVPGFGDMNRRVRTKAGFVLPRGPAERRFETASGRAHFTTTELPRIELRPGQLLMMTVRSHDQYNTTIYGDGDRYRGVRDARRVVLLHEEELRERGLREGDPVELTSHFRRPEGGLPETRSLAGFRVRSHDLPRGCAVTYFPEANPLVPLEQFAEGSFTPAYKSVVITLQRAG